MIICVFVFLRTKTVHFHIKVIFIAFLSFFLHPLNLFKHKNLTCLTNKYCKNVFPNDKSLKKTKFWQKTCESFIYTFFVFVACDLTRSRRLFRLRSQTRILLSLRSRFEFISRRGRSSFATSR